MNKESNLRKVIAADKAFLKKAEAANDERLAETTKEYIKQNETRLEKLIEKKLSQKK